ncbi:F-box-like protein [Ceratobasidium sp. AG-Ba]|nr:F-box-like protein [Ceratobasidium sp. AG-Ba]QRW04729.1 F-box-like protein [Ceratobasidium sp. AG-Ba]
MPPKSRKRAKKSHPEIVTEPSLASQQHFNDTASSSNPGLNTSARTGLPSLPPELFLQILESFREIQEIDIFPNTRYLGESDKEIDYKSRFVVLRGLSQTCRALRHFFLPLLWEHFEASIVWGKKPWYQELGDAMRRKSEGMLQCKHLWPYVK